MASVSALDANDDWTFGKGKANYIRGAAAVRQKVKCRIRCVKADWFLNIKDGIDWNTLCGQRNSQQQILREVERRTLQTPGVRSIELLEVANFTQRVLTLNISFTTIYDTSVNSQLKVQFNG